MEYIGVRSCECDPIEDLGVKYFSSSSDKDFINEQKEHPWHFKYQIISIHPTRSSAINEEISLHEFFDIGINPNYYNRAKQTSTGFDTTGMLFPGKMEGIVSALDCNNNTVKITKYEFDNGDYSGLTSGKVVAIDTRTNSKVHISKGLFDKYDYYVGITSGSSQTLESNLQRSKTTQKTKINNATIWYIYNNQKQLIYTAKGNLKQLCNDNNLPYESLRSSKNNLDGLYSNKNAYPKKKWAHFKGWTIMDTKL